MKSVSVDPSGRWTLMWNVYGVLGVERDYPDNFTVIVQAFAREVMHYSDPEAITNPVARAFAVQQALGDRQSEPAPRASDDSDPAVEVEFVHQNSPICGRRLRSEVPA